MKIGPTKKNKEPSVWKGVVSKSEYKGFDRWGKILENNQAISK